MPDSASGLEASGKEIWAGQGAAAAVLRMAFGQQGTAVLRDRHPRDDPD